MFTIIDSNFFLESDGKAHDGCLREEQTPVWGFEWLAAAAAEQSDELSENF